MLNPSGDQAGGSEELPIHAQAPAVQLGDEGVEEVRSGGARGGELGFQLIHQGHQFVHSGHDPALFCEGREGNERKLRINERLRFP